MSRLQGKSICVIGGGLSGLILAREFSRRGGAVTIVDSDDGMGATKAAQGLSVIKGLLDPRETLFKLKWHGAKAFPKFVKSIIEESGIPVALIKGIREPFSSAAEFAAIKQRVFSGEFVGLNAVEIESNSFFYPDDYWVHAQDFSKALVGAVDRLGVTRIAGVLTNFETFGDRSWSITISTNGSIQKKPFNHLCLATGAGTKSLLANQYLKEPLKTVPGVTATASIDKAHHGVWVHKTYSLAACSGLARIGSIDLEDQEIPNNQHLAKLIAECLSLFEAAEIPMPATSDFFIHYGVRLRTKSRLPMVGVRSIDGAPLGLLSALHKNGFQIAPLAAEALVDLYEGKSISEMWNDCLVRT